MEWEGFNFLHTTIKNTVNQISYVLDSNIVVMLSKYYYKKINNENELNRCEKLYNYLKDKDVVPGIAIRELSWDSEKNIVDKSEEKILIDAMDGLFRIKTFGNKIYKQNRSMSFNTLLNNEQSNQLLLMTFCLIKKYALLYEKESSNENIFMQLVSFVNSEHKMLLSPEMTLITYSLFGKRPEVRNLMQKLFKIKSKHISEKQIYNASWDLFFLRMINSLTANSKDGNTIDNIYNVCLVTEDKALIELGALLLNEQSMSSVSCDGLTMPCSELNMDMIKEEYRELVQEKMGYLNMTSSVRRNFIRNNPNILEYYGQLLRKLRQEERVI